MSGSRKALPMAPSALPGSLAAALERVPDPRRPYGWRPGYEPVPLVAFLNPVYKALDISPSSGR